MTSAGGLSFELSWSGKPGATSATDATWGRLSFSIGENLIWGRRTAEGPAGFEWTWIDLLEHLAEVWPWLELEDGWPGGISPLLPGDFESAVRDRLAELPRQRRVTEEQRFHEFRGRHDLSRCLQGAVAPRLWVVREGNQHWLGSDHRDLRVEAREALRMLEDLGDRIVERISALEDPRAREACEDWRDRFRMGLVQKLEIVTGLSSEALAEVTAGNASTVFETEEAGFEPNELMAAARMVAGIGIVPRSAVRQIIDAIREIPHRPSPELDRLTAAWRGLRKGAQETASPAEDGYRLATWLRAELGLSSDQRAEPAELLQHWDVIVKSVKLGIDIVDAVAAWGTRHGPAVLINADGRHARTANGRRATLAHEIAHLLADRDGALPLAEVLGGHLAKSVEQRARASAAEFLIPRAVAGEAFSKTVDPEVTLEELRERYGASDELIAWQARNSEANLSEATFAFLRGRVRTPDRF